MRHFRSLVQSFSWDIAGLFRIVLFFLLASCRPANLTVTAESLQTAPAAHQTIEPMATKTPLPYPLYSNGAQSYPAPRIPAFPEPYPYPIGTATPFPTPVPTAEWPLYVDPNGGFTLRIPPGWKAVDEPGSFTGPDGYLRSGYLPEMGYLQSAIQVCMRLANSPQGPARKAGFSQNSSCFLKPYPEMNTDLVRWVFENGTDQPERRFFYVEANSEMIVPIVERLQRLSIPGMKKWYRVPVSPLRAEDEAFWQSVSPLPVDWQVEEIPLFDDPGNSSQVYERYRQIPMALKSWPFPVTIDHKATPTPQGGLLAEPNAILEKFGYRLENISPSDRGPLAVYQQDQLVLDHINDFEPVLLSASRADFLLSVTVIGRGYCVIQTGSVQCVDPRTTHRWTSPVFLGERAVAVFWEPTTGQLQLKSGEEVLYAFSTVFTTSPQLEAFRIWDEDWYMQISDTLIRNGENLNTSRGYEAIFDLRRFENKIFYFFRKGPRVGISFDGKVLPLYYDEVQHMGCCSYGMLNPRSSGNKIGFLALRDGMWYFVKLTIGES